MSDTNKPGRQYMLAEAVQKLLTGKGCELMFSFLAIIFIIECDGGVRHLFDPAVTYGYPVGVTSQVFNHLLSSRHGGLAVDHPFFGEQLLPYGLWHGYLFIELAHKLGTEHPTHCPNRKEERRFLLGVGYILPTPIFVDTPTRDDAMQMRMVMHIASPCMQYGDHAGLYPFVARELFQRLPCRTEKRGIGIGHILQCQRVQAVGQCEYDMEVLDGQHIFLARLYPHLSFKPLAFGTMTIAATIVTNPDGATFGTHVPVSSQSGCAALFQMRKDLGHLGTGMIPGNEVLLKTGDNQGHLKFGSHGSGLGSTIGNRSSGLNARPPSERLTRCR